ncbi:Membrane transporter [Trichostrongylus colubriformis]|uniref:Membrane transporter n=1 Tax=Trichostrongylus colubriformis TaxID=6319 RepID=A0AAN8FWW3_TRICO
MLLPSSIYCNRFRYLLLFIGFFCLTSICSNYSVINFTFICMADGDSELIDSGNGTLVSRYSYSPKEKSAIIWAVAIGTIVGTFPINYAYIQYGARWPFFISGMISAFSTAIMPLAAYLGLPVLIVFRFMQGLAYAADFAAIGILCVRWAPLSETSLFISILTCFTQISSVITNPLSGWLCTSSLGWRAAFYVHAAFGVLMFCLWIMFYQDDPHLHPDVTDVELEKIQRDKTQAHIDRDSFVPYKAILKNTVILVVWFNAFVEMVTVTLLIVYAPIYFHMVLGYEVSLTGILVSFATSIHLPLKFTGGLLSDKITCVEERKKMIFFNTIAVGMAGVFCTLIGIFPGDWSKTGVALFTLSITCMGMNPGGFYKCGTLSSRQYAHFVLATIQFMKCVALFVAPGTVALFVYDERRHDQWRYVYWINGALLILANFVFIPIATDQPASFTLITRATVEEEKRKRDAAEPLTLSESGSSPRRSGPTSSASKTLEDSKSVPEKA